MEQHHQLPLPSIQSHGKLLAVHFADGTSSSFHAQWLWLNDPSNIYMTSGQRRQSPGSYTGAVIAIASILTVSDLDPSLQSKYKPRPGSTNPILTYSYGGEDNENDRDGGKHSSVSASDMSNFILLVHWKDKEVPPSTLSDDAKKYNKYCLTSMYNMQWLQQWSYDPKSFQIARVMREIATETHTFTSKYRKGDERREAYDGLLNVDYNALMNSRVEDIDNEHLLYFMDAVFNDGAIILTNAPDMKHESLHDIVVSNVGKALGGELSHGSLYGNTFHVKSVPNANNVAYTADALCPHQDLAYYESKPGFQLLHCKSMPSDIVGGESILIDCMAAAHTMRDLAPDLFETLVKCPATFVKQREGACMTYSKPHIVLQQSGHDDLNDMMREIVAIHWAPPFEGPLNIPPDQVPKYYKAYAAFELMLDNTKCPLVYSENFDIDVELTFKLSNYAKEYTWERRLAPGEIIVFNNNRFLHGRRGYHVEFRSNESKVRHLIGAYTNIDDSLNKYRVLLEKMGATRAIPNIGNGTISTLPRCI